MARLIALIVLVGALAVAAAWLADHPGAAVLRWQGWEARASVAVLGGLVLLALASFIVVGRLWGWARHGLGAAGRGRDARRRERGFRVLGDGLIAVAAGDARAARRLGRQAAGLLGGSSLPLLIEAQAAQSTGDEAEAKRLFERMLARPETEFIALRSLTAQARKAGDVETALGYVRRARAIKPDAPWVLGALAELEARAGHWREAEQAVAEALRVKALPRGAAERQRASLLVAQARDAARDGDAATALARAREAHRLDPALVPAAALLAEQARALGKATLGAKAIETTWTKAPHPDLARLYVAGATDALARLKRLETLATHNPDHVESRIAVAEAAVAAGLWGEARRWLGPLLAGDPPARACRLMAAVERSERRDEAASRGWLERAGAGAPDAAWLCPACGVAAPDWSPHCSACGSPEASAWLARARPVPASLIAAPA